jgi:hypothetical protein
MEEETHVLPEDAQWLVMKVDTAVVTSTQVNAQLSPEDPI